MCAVLPCYLPTPTNPADLTPAEAHHMLVLLHEWDLAGCGRHSLTDVYVCLQLLALVRVSAGALSSTVHQTTTSTVLDRPDSRLSNATASSNHTTTSTAALPPGSRAVVHEAAGGQGSNRQQQRSKPSKQGSSAVVTSEGMTGGVGALHGGVRGVGGGGGGLSLKEAYLKERVAGLEAELARVTRSGGHGSSGGGGAAHNSKEVGGCVGHCCSHGGG